MHVTAELEEAAFQVAPCLEEGAIAESARSLVVAARSLGTTRSASLLRAWSIPYLFEHMERGFASSEEPGGAIRQSLETLTQFMRVASASGLSGLGESDPGKRPSLPLDGSSVQGITGEHYGHLFRAFDAEAYWGEAVRLLRERLERNGISLSELSRKEVLDAGCGGGRYTVAWRLLGARQATGIDVSEIAIADAKGRVAEGSITSVVFQQGDVLRLPFPGDSFDIVFSNGVLHHTADWQLGVAELVRVLKPGGMGWLYLIEKPGGLFWDVIELLRVIMTGEGREMARAALRLLGIPANRIFYMLDHVMVPINLRLSPAEIEQCLVTVGASRVRRLARGTDFDRIERIYRGEPFATVKYGVGENRYVFSKE